MPHRNVPQPRILLLEDSSVDAELIEAQLEACDPLPVVTRAATRAAYQAALKDHAFDIILSDFSLPDFDGMGALEMAVAHRPNTPFIFVSGVLGEEAAIEAFRKGATDYILKQRLIRLPAAVQRALKEARDRAERRRAEEQKDLLVRELSHRVKNNLAVILSLIRRTAAADMTVESFQAKLIERVRALSDAHALLFESNWSDTDLLSIFRRAIRPYDGDPSRFDLGRHDLVTLNPTSALSLGMILNELVSNAATHGALSNAMGRISVDWQVGPDDAGKPVVRLHWMERGGPSLGQPNEAGFGNKLVRANVEYELDGAVEVTYAPEGAVITLSFPLGSRLESML